MGISRLSDKALRDPLEFIPAFLRHPDGQPINPHAAQVAIIQAFMSGVFDLVIEAGRQLGKSVGLAWFIVWYSLYFANREIYIVAPSLDQARIIYDEVERHFEGPLRVMLKRKPIDFPFPKIELLNGSRVHGRGANSPKYLRGKLVHLLIEDEAEYFKDGIHTRTIEPMFAVTSTMDHTGIIRISTPFGEGDFADGVEAAKKDTTGRSKYLHFTSLDNPYANKDLLYSIRDRYGEDSLVWRTEYLAERADSELAVFPSADIKWAYENYPYQTEHGRITYPVMAQAKHTYTQGADLANMRDYFVATMLDSTDPRTAVQVRHDRMRKKGYGVYKSIIKQNYYAYNNAKTLIDATSLGESVVEDLREIAAEGYKFTGTAAKMDIVHNLVRMFNEHRITIPNVRELVDELRNYQYQITPSKNLRMEAKTGHDDYVTSLALAGDLASRPTRTGFFLGGFGPSSHVPDGTWKSPLPKRVDPFADLFSQEDEIIHGKSAVQSH